MNLVSITFLLVMILAGGLVALIADKLGRTLGKKRLTLFGLRPRHTATMITVFAGMVIPFITVLLMAAVSKDAREWITEGQQALQQRDQLRGQVADLEKQKTQAANEFNGIKKENEEELRKQAKRLALVTQRVKDLTSQTDVLKQQAKALAARAQSLEATVLQTNKKVAAAQAGLKLANDAKLLAQHELDLTSKQLQATKDSFFELKRQTDELNKQNFQLSTQNDKLTDANKTLASQNVDMDRKLGKSKVDLEHASLNLDEVKTLLQDTNNQLVTANNQLNAASQALWTDFGTSRGRPLIVGIGDEIARISIPAGTSSEDAKGLYANLMKSALQFAISKGAKPHPEEKTGPDAAGLAPRIDAQGNSIDADGVESKIITGITNQKEDIVLIASDFANTFEGEWLPIAVQPYSNPIVYHRNDKVAETSINGSETEAAIIQHISDFLTKIVKPKALKDQMIPESGQEEEFGSVPLSEIVQLAHTIMDAGRPMKLAALAANDTRRGDPLQLHFRVR